MLSKKASALTLLLLMMVLAMFPLSTSGGDAPAENYRATASICVDASQVQDNNVSLVEVTTNSAVNDHRNLSIPIPSYEIPKELANLLCVGSMLPFIGILIATTIRSKTGAIKKQMADLFESKGSAVPSPF